MIARYSIRERSMDPSICEGEKVLVFKTRNVKKGDIIVFEKNGIEMIKRITKNLGDTLFVEGDNRKESTDSRHYGPISRKDIVGKVVLKY